MFAASEFENLYCNIREVWASYTLRMRDIMYCASHLELIILKLKSLWLVGYGEKNILRILVGKPFTM
jgi:hypothetical protein